MTIETEMSLNADGNTAVTACLRQQLSYHSLYHTIIKVFFLLFSSDGLYTIMKLDAVLFI